MLYATKTNYNIYKRIPFHTKLFNLNSTHEKQISICLYSPNKAIEFFNLNIFMKKSVLKLIYRNLTIKCYIYKHYPIIIRN